VWSDGAAEDGIRLGIDLLRIDHALDQPGDEQSAKRSSSRRREDGLRRETGRARRRREVRRSVRTRVRARASRRVQSFAPARARRRLSVVGLRSRMSARSRSRSLRRRLERPREGRQRPAPGRALHVRSSNRATTSSQNGLGSRGTPSSPAASRRRRVAARAGVHVV
jgi:hypothetical protein